MAFGVSTDARTATNYGSVTPSDTVNFPDEVAGFFIGGAGNVVTIKRDGTAVTWTGLTAGSWLPVAAIRVNATNTTATLINWYT
jgi:hypothetical protein